MAAEAQRYLRTLGGLSLHVSREEPPDGDPLLHNAKPLALLAYLAASPDRSARRGHLAPLLWPDLEPGRARRALRQALYYLTDRAGTELLERSDDVLRVREDRLGVDLWDFQEALGAEDWDRAVELYGGTFLAGFGDKAGRELEHWIEARNEQIWSGLKAAYHRSVTGLLEEGLDGRAVERAESYVELNPMDPRAHRTRVETLIAAGREVEALQAYREMTARLAGDPPRELRERMRDLEAGLFSTPEPRPEKAEVADLPESEPTAAAAVGDGAPPSEAGAAVHGPPAWSRSAAVAVALVAAAAAAVWVVGEGGTGTSGEARLWAWFQGDSTLRRLELGDGEVRSVRTGLDHRTVVAPTGDQVARAEAHPEGLDLVVAARDGEERRRLTSRPYDERPLDWAPDGRRLLYDFLETTRGGRDYVRRLAVYDLEAGRSHRLLPGAANFGRHDDWGPRGVWIAAAVDSGANTDVYLVTPDGTVARRLTRHPAADLNPSLSPDGGQVAFSSGRDGNVDLYVVDVDGTDLRRLTTHPARDRAPFWISGNELVFATDRDGPRSLWRFRLPTGPARPIPGAENLARVAGSTGAGPRDGWIDSVDARPVGPLTVSPGQRLSFAVSVLTESGDSIPPSDLPLRWTVADTAVASAGPAGRLTVRDTGRTTLRVTSGGWRSDTVALVSRPVVARELEPAMVERWTAGIARRRWVTFGEPSPYVRPARGAAPSPSAMVNNGDQHFESGLVSARAFALERGLTVMWWTKLPFTDRLYETSRVALTAADPPSPGRPVWRPLPFPAAVALQEQGRSVEVDDQRGVLPPTARPARWRRYALQVDRERRVWLLAADTLLWRSRPAASLAGVDSVRVVLSGRSWKTELLVGPVRVYEGERYCLRC